MDSSSPKPKPRKFKPRLPPPSRLPIDPISNTEAEVKEENENAARRIDGYENPYDPIVLPLRNPNSGDPDLLDLEEFGEGAKHPDYDEKNINSAKEVGLTSEQHCKDQMLFLKFPDSLPVTKQSTGENTNQSVTESVPERSNPFEGLAEGYIGKMQIHKSGAVKLKLGDVLFDVSPGSKEQPANDVVVIDTEGKNCVRLGSNAKLAVVTPDVESLLKSDSDEETHK